MKKSRVKMCPCQSDKLYKDCCEPFHNGALPSNAYQLMRSRYSAYALSLADYIMDTTHPLNHSYSKDKTKWRSEILNFSKNTKFENLKIVDFQDGSQEAFVHFIAYLKQGKEDVSFQEKSHFLKEQGKWLYCNGNALSLPRDV